MNITIHKGLGQRPIPGLDLVIVLKLPGIFVLQFNTFERRKVRSFAERLVKDLTIAYEVQATDAVAVTPEYVEKFREIVG